MKTQTIKPASPLPWKSQFGYEIVAANGNKVVFDAIWNNNIDPDYIVHAANNYPQLVEALEKIAGLTETQGAAREIQRHMGEIARAALAAAKGTP